MPHLSASFSHLYKLPRAFAGQLRIHQSNIAHCRYFITMSTRTIFVYLFSTISSDSDQPAEYAGEENRCHATDSG